MFILILKYNKKKSPSLILSSDDWGEREENKTGANNWRQNMSGVTGHAIYKYHVFYNMICCIICYDKILLNFVSI